MKSKPYVGVKAGRRSVFRSADTPTTKSHGELFNAVIGPFRTVRGAKYMQMYGGNNPHLQTVADAERIARAG